MPHAYIARFFCTYQISSVKNNMYCRDIHYTEKGEK
jgi:hypothetical protein